MSEITGLPVSVLRNAEIGDCTANGVTKFNDSFKLVDESLQAPFNVEEDEVYLKLVYRQIFPGTPAYIHAEPYKNGQPIIPAGHTGMFGGNFVYTSDSRFPNKYPIPVHDRFESWETYERMSR